MRVALAGGQFIAEGNYAECAAWAFTLIDLERQRNDQILQKYSENEANKVAELLAKPISELMKDECKEDQSHE